MKEEASKQNGEKSIDNEKKEKDAEAERSISWNQDCR